MGKRVALITGGMGGLGNAMCQELAHQGHIVLTTYTQDHERAAIWLNKNKEAGYDFKAYQCDVSDYPSCKKAFDKIKIEVGAVDILVNNAGIARDSSFKKLTKDDWDSVIKTNLDSMFNVSKQVVNEMIEKKWGRIINISSINGQKGQFGQTNYSASKAGIHGFSMALAQELAQKGITVNTIAPGYIATNMMRSIPNEVREKIIAQIPLGRLGDPEEVAKLVAYLASDASAFITGAEIAINGGQHMA